MNQEKWAETIGISYGLVKRIEAHTIKCSTRTRTKVQLFMEKKSNTPDLPKQSDLPDPYDLETHVIFDIFLTKLKQVPKSEASSSARHCTKALQYFLSYIDKCDSSDTQIDYFQFMEWILYIPFYLSYENQELDNETIAHATEYIKALRKILSQKFKCNSPDAQKIYFQFLEDAFTTLYLASADIVSDINKGEDVLNIDNGLNKVFTDDQITKIKKFKEKHTSDNGEIYKQLDFSDNPDFLSDNPDFFNL